MKPTILLDTGPTDWPVALGDLAGCDVGQLLTPLTRYRRHDQSRPWAIDNGGFARQDMRSFRSLLAREDADKSALFVAVPDVPGNARRTLELFRRLTDEDPHLHGWPLAMVLQDGIEDLDIPWSKLSAVFVGGTDRFKESTAAADCMRAAKWLGLHVHVGRVNTSDRLSRLASHWSLADSVGLSEHGIDSIDGTGISRFSHMRCAVRDSILGVDRGWLFDGLALTESEVGHG